MIDLIDFGAGNLQSALHAFQVLQGTKTAGEQPVRLIEKPDEIRSGTKALILPGDGSFKSAYDRLKQNGFAEYFKSEDFRKSKLPLLGICVGFQLLFDHSEEDGGSEGLGLLRGKVRRFSKGDLKIPHMGWNQCRPAKASPLLEGIKDNDFFYFVHSYYAEIDASESSSLLLGSDYGIPFPAAVEKGLVSGFQFHPEKSHRAGWRILENFVKSLK